MKALLRTVLLYIQRYTKTDMRYLARSGFWLSLGHVVQIVGGLIVTIVLANTIPKNMLGTYQFVIATATVLGAFTLTGLSTAIIKSVAKGQYGALRAGVRTKFKWNIGIVIASGVVATYYFIQGNQLLGTAFLIVGACAPFIESFHLYQPFLLGAQNFRFNAILGIVRKLGPMLSVLAVALTIPTPLALISAYFVGNALTLACNYLITVRYYQPPIAADISQTVQFSKHLSLMNIAGRVTNSADKILLFHHLGAAAVASFMIAQLPTKYTASLLNLLKSLMLPKLVKRELKTLQSTLPRKVAILTVFIVGVMGLYIFSAPYLFGWFFPTYPESILLTQVLALGLLAIPRTSYTYALTAHERTAALYIINVGIPVVKLGLLYGLIWQFGIWGAVYAILLSDLLSLIISYTLFARAQS